MIVIDNTDEKTRRTVCLKDHGKQFYHSFWVDIENSDQMWWLNFSRANVTPIWREIPSFSFNSIIVSASREGPSSAERVIIEGYWKDPE